MYKTYKFRLYPTKTQTEKLESFFAGSDAIWNYFAKKCEACISKNEHIPNEYESSREITKLRHENGWISSMPRVVCEGALHDFYSALFVMNKNKKITNWEVPSERDVSRTEKSFSFPVVSKIFDGNTHVKIPKAGAVKCSISVMETGEITHAVVIKTKTKKYFICLCDKTPKISDFPKTGRYIGIDVGVKIFITTSDGEKINKPRFLLDKREKLSEIKLKMLGKEVGSREYEKLKMSLNRTKEKIDNQNDDFFKKLSNSLLKRYDIVFMETLGLREMRSKFSDVEVLNDVAWRKFYKILKNQAKISGKKVVLVSKYFPSSRICSSCGRVNDEVNCTDIREWTCPHCGTHHDRDVNAAKNILNEGLRILGR